VLASSALALLSSIVYGTADFLGGLASKRASTIAVVIVSQAAGLLVLPFFPLLPPAEITPPALWWGAAAGLSGGVGVALLYRALAIGPMSLVAPVTAVCAALIPVLAGVAMGERLSALSVAGIVLAMTAIVLVGQDARPDASGFESPRRGALPIAVASGVSIGLFLVSLERTPASAGLWPLIAARVVSVSFFSVVASTRAHAWTMTRRAAWVAIAGGCADMTANVLYLLAVREGPLSVIATLVSLYPASTVVLARLVLGERLRSIQTVGVVAAVAAVIMIVGGT
jgi:uncharacterized membrane protein